MSLTNDPLASQVPSTWQPYVPLIASLLRDVLKIGGAFGLTWSATVTDSQITTISSALAVAVGVGWSLIQKRRADAALKVAAENPAGLPAPKLPA